MLLIVFLRIKGGKEMVNMKFAHLFPNSHFLEKICNGNEDMN